MSDLADVQVGDEVILDHGSRASLDRVARVTAKMVHVRGTRYRRADGGEVGARSFPWALPRSIRRGTDAERDALRDEWKRQAVIAQLHDAPWEKLTLEDLRTVAAILDAALVRSTP